MRLFLKALFVAVFLSMIWVTTMASMSRSVIPAIVEFWNDPWGRATLFDTYFAFMTFYLWVAYKECGWVRRIVWFIAIMALGNIAISVFMLKELFGLRADESWDTLLTRRNG